MKALVIWTLICLICLIGVKVTSFAIQYASPDLIKAVDCIHEVAKHVDAAAIEIQKAVRNTKVALRELFSLTSPEVDEKKLRSHSTKPSRRITKRPRKH